MRFQLSYCSFYAYEVKCIIETGRVWPKDAKPQNMQINLSLLRVWKKLLENLARIMAAEETHNLTWHDLTRRAVKEDPSFQMNQSRHSAHSTYLCRYHLIFCPKFRFSVLKDSVDETLKEILQKICDRYRYEVQALEFMPDHIHLFLSAPQTAAPADIAWTIKSISAIELFNLNSRSKYTHEIENCYKFFY